MAVGRLDFWNLDKELTPYEQAVWRASEIVEPWGEKRADMRMAMQTLSVMQSRRTTLFSEEERRSILRGLLNYWKTEEEPEHLTPDEAAKRGKEAFAAIGK